MTSQYRCKVTVYVAASCFEVLCIACYLWKVFDPHTAYHKLRQVPKFKAQNKSLDFGRGNLQKLEMALLRPSRHCILLLGYRND